MSSPQMLYAPSKSVKGSVLVYLSDSNIVVRIEAIVVKEELHECVMLILTLRSSVM
jgi:hypothetical protein